MSGATEYRKVRVSDRLVPEHLRVAAEMLGRELFEGEVVHHINGHKGDNRAVNLLVLPSRKAHSEIAGIIGVFLEEKGLQEELKQWYATTQRPIAEVQSQLHRLKQEREKLSKKVKHSERGKNARIDIAEEQLF